MARRSIGGVFVLGPAALFLAAAVSALAPGCSPRPPWLAPDEALAEGFARPPEEARPWVYWMWMDGNLTREGITADLEAMRAAGLGGVVICEVNVGVPRGPVEFMSPEWRRLFKHVVREAERLGLEVTLNAGPGWTGSGGPWVEPERSMQHIVAAAVDVSGPARFDAVLPRPSRRPAFFGEGGLPQPLKDAMDGFYRDVAVVAFPTPAPGPAIDAIDEKALYVRAPYSSQAGVRPFIPSPADHPALPAGAAVDPSRVIDLSDKLAADGRLAWDVPPGRWTVLRFGRTTTGANTRPAPVPGLGLECDKLDAAAFDAHYDDFVGALLREIGPRRTDGKAGWTTLHIDSWEMGAQNWTAAFREEFLRRRAYDPLPYLPAVTGLPVGSSELTERFLWDLRQTANELVLENHALRLKELGRRDGFRLSIEPYDMTPCADMTLGTAADVPMSEFWLYGFHTAHSVYEAAGLAHTGGKRIMAAEAFTSMDTEAWRAHPASMKPLGDWAFAAGVNRVVFHRYQNQAAMTMRPGMTMGPFGVHWERTQTWWDMVPAYHEYLSRCQFMLRRGLPVADVCFLVAEGAPHVFRPPASALRGDPPGPVGPAFDGCPPETLLASARVEDGRVVFPDGMSYRVLVLPERETMTPALLKKVRDLVEAGATVVGPRPRKSPSLSGFPECDAEVERLAAEVWGECDGERVTENAFGLGRVVWVREARPASGAGGAAPLGAVPGAAPALPDAVNQADIAAPPEPSPARPVWSVGAPPLDEPSQYGDFAVVTDVLDKMSVEPDLLSEAPLRWTHRRDGGMEIYFLVNPQDRVLETTVSFRVSGERPELWDPVTGKIRKLVPDSDVDPKPVLLSAAATEHENARFLPFEKDGRTQMGLRFEPFQSFFVVFREEERSPADTPKQLPPALRGGPSLERPSIELNTFEGPWEVAFDPAWGGPEKVVFESLDDWSARPEEGIRYYSGTAVYRMTFDLPRKTSRRGERLWLDLGEVRNIAAVRINGRDLGVVWCDPWRMDITDAVRKKDNRLEVRVANLWPNRLIGDEREPPDAEYAGNGRLIRWPDWLLRGEPRPSAGRFTFSTWKHYSADSALLPSGLLGPVRVLRGSSDEN